LLLSILNSHKYRLRFVFSQGRCSSF